MSTSQTSYQHIVQYFERRNVLRQYHDERTASHFGIRKTLSKVGLRYYWPVLERDVRQSLAGCIPCAKRKYDNVTKSHQ